MAYEGPFSKRIISNLVYIQESGLQFSGGVGVEDSSPIILDATQRFSKSVRASVTENPVGDKSDRADHYRVYSPTLKFSGVISNSALATSLLAEDPTKASTDELKVYPWAAEVGKARAQQFVERLERIFDKKKLVTIHMPDGLVTDNCLITNLNVSRDAKWSDGFYVEISAKQIQLLKEDILKEPIAIDKDLVEEETDNVSGTGTDESLKQQDVITPREAYVSDLKKKVLANKPNL